MIDIDEIDHITDKVRCFSRNRFNLFSFHDRDHGDGKSKDITDWVRQALREANLHAEGSIKLLFYPRMLGYAFNPLSVYYCYDEDDKLYAIFYAVRNTFGGRHTYLIPVVDGQQTLIHQQADKIFHVSPFIDMNMLYNFVLMPPKERISVTIKVNDPEGPILSANFSGDEQEFNDRSLLRLFFRYPMMTLKVIVGIHWQAVKLMIKGMRLRAGDPDPAQTVTVVRQDMAVEARRV